jgi:hypothetical protein
MRKFLHRYLVVSYLFFIGCNEEQGAYEATLNFEEEITIPLSNSTKITSVFNPVEKDNKMFLANLSKDTVGNRIDFYDIGDASLSHRVYLQDKDLLNHKTYNQTFLIQEGKVFLHHTNQNIISIFEEEGAYVRSINLQNGLGTIYPQPRFQMLLEDDQITSFVLYEGNPKDPEHFRNAIFEVGYDLSSDTVSLANLKYPQSMKHTKDFGWEYWKVSKAKLNNSETAYSFPYNDTLFIVNGSSTIEKIPMGNNLRLNNFQAELPEDFEIQFDFIAKTGVYGSTHYINPNLIAQVFFPAQEVKRVNGELKMFPEKDFKVLLIDRNIGKVGEALFKGSEFTHVGVFTHQGHLYVPHFSWKDPKSDDFYQLHKYRVVSEG